MYLVTGGAGFIGSHIVKRLVKLGCQVRVLDNLSSGKLDNLRGCLEQIEFVEADIRDGSLERAFKDIRVVLHQAAVASVERSIRDPVDTESNNAAGTLNILKLAKESGIKRIVLASTAAVYGNANSIPLKEDCPVNPLSPYAISKYTGEIYARYFSEMFNLETVALRYFNVFGPNQDPGSDYSGVISKFLDRMVNQNSPVIFGDGQQTRDFIYVDNIVKANLLAAQSPRVGQGEAINIACGQSISINELVKTVNAVLGTGHKPVHREARKGDVRHSRADISRARELLGFEPEINLDEGLRRLWEWWRGKNPAISNSL